jgi:hypothetical protein
MVDCCCCDPPPGRRDRRSIRPVAVPVVVPGDHRQMSDATTKEGHVNYEVSDVLVEARAAPTMGRGCYGWVTAQQDDAKNRQFFWWERAEAEARYAPRRRNSRYRAHREGSWEGGGSLVDGDSIVPCGGHDVSP